jgi:tetratricopeptide (TPR) repeat protein
VPDPVLGEQARLAADRARALRPDDPLVYLAAGDLYGSVNPIDNERAAAEYERGLRLAPDNVDLLSAAATAQTRLEGWDSVGPRLERALRLDPRSPTAARRLATAHLLLRHYAAADSTIDRAIALAPTSVQLVLLKVVIALEQGDLGRARSVIDAAAQRIDRTTLLAFIATYQDLYWVLTDDQREQVLGMPPSAFDDDRGSWAITRTGLYLLRGDRRRAAVFADSARLAFEDQLRSAPNDAQRHVFRGLALAYLGRKAEAIREGRRGVELLPISRDGYVGPYIQLQLVRIYIQTGERASALDQLEPLLRVPFYLSPAWLRIDPGFDPLRTEPRFQRLVAGNSSP